MTNLNEIAAVIAEALKWKYPRGNSHTDGRRENKHFAKVLFYPTGQGHPVEIIILPQQDGTA